MIRSFADTATERIWNGGPSRKIPPDVQQRAFRILKMLDATAVFDDLKNPPGNHLHALKDERPGQHSISINDQWRNCFVWKDADAYDVEIVDYH